MSAQVETVAYTGAVPWYGWGFATSNDRTPAQMCQDAQVTWTVSKRPMFMQVGDKQIQIPDRLALCRDTDDTFYDVVSDRWKPIQNEEAMDFFSKFVAAGHMSMETVGSLWGGKIVWGLARLNHDFKIGVRGGDEVRSYLLMALPHQLGSAMVFQFTSIRVVCWNTLSWALGSSLKGNGTGFKVNHSTKFDDSTKQRAEIALGLGNKQMDEFKEVAGLLSKKKLTEAAADEYFCDVLKFDAKKAKKDGEREPRMLPRFRAALAHSPGAELPTAKGTYWGALNAVSYVIDHESGRSDRGTALKNAWFGNLANVKRRAVDVAIERAKKAKGA